MCPSSASVSRVPPRECQDRIGAAGGSTRRFEGLAHESSLLSKSIVTEHAIDRLSKAVRRGLSLGKVKTRPKPFDLPGYDLLLAHLGHHHQRNAVVEAFAHAVH